MRLNHNMFSILAYNTYNKNLEKNDAASSKISSGIKLSSARDNPSKIGSSEQLKIQIKSLDMASKNVQDGVSMIQTAEGALSEVSDMLNRMRELTLSAADDTKTSGDKKAIQAEVNQLTSAIKDISKQTSFNGVKMIGDTSVLDNNNPNYISTQIGYKSAEKLEIPFFNISATNLNIDSIDVTTSTGATNALNNIEGAIKQISNIRGAYGAISNRLETSYNNLNLNSDTLESASSRLTDADIASEIIEYTRTNILTEASIAIMAQTNKMPQNALEALKNSR